MIKDKITVDGYDKPTKEAAIHQLWLDRQIELAKGVNRND